LLALQQISEGASDKSNALPQFHQCSDFLCRIYMNAQEVHLHVFLMMEQRPFPRSAWEVEEDPDAAKAAARFRCHLLPEASSK
jgi:hypothetical protein